MTITKNRTNNVVLCGMFAAVMAVCAWISVPIAVPITLQTLAVFTALVTLGGKLGTVSITVYIFLGAAGLPVFSGFKGGIGVLIGNTGGYILGFILAGLVYWFAEYLFGDKLYVAILSMFLGMLLYYTTGTLWFKIAYTRNVSDVTFRQIIEWCIIPFIIPDIIKIVLAVVIGNRIKRISKML